MPATPNQLPTTLEEVDFGKASKWVMRFTAAHNADEALYAAMDRDNSAHHQEAIFQGMFSLVQDVTGIGKIGGRPVPVDIAGRQAGLESHLEQALAGVNDRVTQYERMSKVYDNLREHQHAFGEQLANVPPAPYVTKVLGHSNEAVSRRWRQVRGSIELFRHLHGHTDPEITLGPASAEAWSQTAREITCKDIGRIQLSQIISSPDSLATAADFGQEHIITEIGLPPRLSEQQLTEQLDRRRADTWMDQAYRLLSTDHIQ